MRRTTVFNFKTITSLGRTVITLADATTDLVSINADSLVKLSRAGNNIAGVAEDATGAWRESALLQLQRDHAIKLAEFDLPSN
jgi:hypothetical protein